MRNFFTWRNTKWGFIIGILAVLSALPYQYYHFHYGLRPYLIEKLEYSGLLSRAFIAQLILLLIASVISATMGFAWSNEKYNLHGWGNKKTFKHKWYRYILLGVALSLLSFVSFDRYFIHIIPEFYPNNPFWAFSYILQSAFLVEIIYRYGLITWAVRLTNSKICAITLSCIFAIFLAIREIYFFNLILEYNYICIMIILRAIISSILLGYLYVKYGLGASMIVHGTLELHFILMSKL